MPNSLVGKEYNNLVIFAEHRIKSLDIKMTNGRDLVDYVIRKTLEFSPEKTRCRAYLQQGIANYSINLKRKEAVKSYPQTCYPNPEIAEFGNNVLRSGS